MQFTLPGGISSRPCTPTSSRRSSFSEPDPGSVSIQMPETDPAPAPHAADPEAGAGAPLPAQAPGPWRTGKSAAALGALVSGVHQFFAQGVGVIGRAGFQTGMILWAGSALSKKAPAASSPAAPVPHQGNRTDPAAGTGSEDTGRGQPEGSADGGSGELPSDPTLHNQTGNITFFGNETQRWNGTDPWVAGGPGNQTQADPAGHLRNGTQDAPAGGGSPEAGAAASADADAGSIEVLPWDPAAGPLGVPLAPAGPSTALADTVAVVQGGLVPSESSLPAPAALPGALHMGNPDVQASPALWGPIGLSGAILATSVLLSASRVWDLGRGALAAIRNWDPQTQEGRRRGACLTAAMGLMASLAPVGYALGADTPKAQGSDARMMLAAWLLINAAGRTCQNLLRDTFTQTTRGLVPSLQYSIPPEPEGHPGQDAPWRVAGPGSKAFGDLHLNPRVLGMRVGLTLASYWAGAYLCMAYLTPALKQAMGTGRLDLAVQAEHHLDSMEVLEASLPALVGSVCAETMDSISGSLSTSAAAAAAGARIELVRAKALTAAEIFKAIWDNVSVRFHNSISTVDFERAISTLLGADRDSARGVVIQSLVLMFTDIRGFLVQLGQHQLKIEEARARQQPEPVQPVVVLPLQAPLDPPVLAPLAVLPHGAAEPLTESDFER